MSYSSKDIDMVVNTHLHLDHAGNDRMFTEAEFVIQKGELEFALDPPRWFRGGYLPEVLQGLEFTEVEGDKRISVAIKYLTQSTWSHAALYIGPALGRTNEEGESLCFVEADITEGVRAVPLSLFHGLHTRICRPVRYTA